MKDKKIIIVKRIKRKEEFNSRELDHCKFVGVQRAAVSDDNLPQELCNETQIGNALKDGWRVLAVCSVPVEVPFAVLNVEAKSERRIFNVSGYVLSKLTTGREFYDWALLKLAQQDEIVDTDFWEELYYKYGLDDYFHHLINGENVLQLEKHRLYATDFGDLGEKLRKWFVVVDVASFRVEDARQNPSVELKRCYDEVNKAKRREEAERNTATGIIREEGTKMVHGWLRDAIQSLRNHPFRVVALVAITLLMLRIVIGCWSSYSKDKATQDTLRDINNAAKLAEGKKNKPVKGSIAVRNNEAASEAAVRLLQGSAEAFARQIVSEHSSNSKAWTDSTKIELPARAWAEMITKTQAFVSGSDGEFSCIVDGNDITIETHPLVVKEYVLDVAFLRGDASMVGLVSKAFGVSFGGQARLGPSPMRTVTRRSALRALEGSNVRVEVSDDGGELVFSPNFAHLAKADASVAGMTDAEISGKADAFWRDVAAVKFESIPNACLELRARFAPYDIELEDGFDDAVCALESLLQDINDRIVEGNAFLGECDKPWRQYSEARPADKNLKQRKVADALKGLESLKTTVAARFARISFEKDVAAFKKGKAEFLHWGAEMIKCYNAQQSRIAKMGQIRQNIGIAKASRDFSSIPSFEAQVLEAENSQRSNRQREMQIGLYVASICNTDYFSQTYGSAWVRSMIRKHGSTVASADVSVITLSSDFSADVQRLYGAATLEKALSKGRQLSDAVVENHKEARDGKTLSDMGAEVAYVNGLRGDIVVLKRAQRKSN